MDVLIKEGDRADLVSRGRLSIQLNPLADISGLNGRTKQNAWDINGCFRQSERQPTATKCSESPTIARNYSKSWTETLLVITIVICNESLRLHVVE